MAGHACCGTGGCAHGGHGGAVHFRGPAGLWPLVEEQLAQGVESPPELLFLDGVPFDIALMCAFKVVPCPKAYPHSTELCPFAHAGENAVRRDPRLYQYSGVKCRDKRRGKFCSRGDMCPNAHNVFELWLHPRKFRTELCQAGEHCERVCCFFAHSIEELRVGSEPLPPSYFKLPMVTAVPTVHCPAQLPAAQLPGLPPLEPGLPALSLPPVSATALGQTSAFSQALQSQDRLASLASLELELQRSRRIEQERARQLQQLAFEEAAAAQAMECLALGQQQQQHEDSLFRGNSLPRAPHQLAWEAGHALLGGGGRGLGRAGPTEPARVNSRGLLQDMMQWRSTPAPQPQHSLPAPPPPPPLSLPLSLPPIGVVEDPFARRASNDSADSRAGSWTPMMYATPSTASSDLPRLRSDSLGSAGSAPPPEDGSGQQRIVPAYALALQRALQTI